MSLHHVLQGGVRVISACVSVRGGDRGVRREAPSVGDNERTNAMDDVDDTKHASCIISSERPRSVDGLGGKQG
jgi:hypothetical protein